MKKHIAIIVNILLFFLLIFELSWLQSLFKFNFIFIQLLVFKFRLKSQPSLLISFGIKRNSSPGQYLGNFNSILLTIIDILKLEVLGLPITKLAYVIFPAQLKFRGFTVSCIVLTRFHSDDEASWLRITELHPRWAAPSDLRHLGLKRYPL